jgi:hypothetical protein
MGRGRSGKVGWNKIDMEPFCLDGSDCLVCVNIDPGDETIEWMIGDEN